MENSITFNVFFIETFPYSGMKFGHQYVVLRAVETNYMENTQNKANVIIGIDILYIKKRVY